MFNEHQYNQVQYNGSLYVTINEDSSLDSVSFGRYGLNNDIVFLTDVQILGPDRQYESFNNPDSHGKTNTIDFFRVNYIVLKGYIIRSTLSDLEEYIDTLYKGLAVREQYLIINKGHKTRRYKATWTNTQNSILRENYHKEYVPFEFRFTVEDPPFGEDDTLTVVSESSLTVSESSLIIENNGNVESYLNTILLINSASNLTSIQVENETTGELLIVSETISAGDILQMNGEVTTSGSIKSGKNVLLNGVNTAYNGVIPSLAVGNNTITITVTSSSHNIDVNLITRNRYLI